MRLFQQLYLSVAIFSLALVLHAVLSYDAMQEVERLSQEKIYPPFAF